MSIHTSGIMELIATLRKEGILEIEKERNKVINAANENAAKIVQDAQCNSKQLMKKCLEDCEKIKKNLNDELKIASRDFLLVFSKNIKKHIIKPIIKKNVNESINDTKFFKKILSEILKEAVTLNNNNLLVLINNQRKNEMIEFFSNDIFKNIRGSEKITFEFTSKFNGFQIIQKDENFIWDFTLQSLTQEIGKLIEPHLIKYFI